MRRLSIGLTAAGLLVIVAALSRSNAPAPPAELRVQVEERNPWTHLRLNNGRDAFQFNKWEKFQVNIVFPGKFVIGGLVAFWFWLSNENFFLLDEGGNSFSVDATKSPRLLRFAEGEAEVLKLTEKELKLRIREGMVENRYSFLRVSELEASSLQSQD